MKKLLILLFFPMLFFISCGKTSVQPEIGLKKTIQPEENKISIIQKTNFSFIYLQYNTNKTLLDNLQGDTNFSEFIDGVSNEMASALNRNKNLSNAIVIYERLTNKFDLEKGYLFQRMGISYFKLKNLSKANKYINQAIMENTANPELTYYKSLLLMYYNKNPGGALDLINRTDLDSIPVSKQDLLVYQGSLQEALSNPSAALNYYQTALNIDPLRFYQNYDLTYFLLKSGNDEKAKTYQQESFAGLMGLKKDGFTLKAYVQAINVNRALKRETLSIHFNLQDIYNVYNNILYNYSNPETIDRIKSAHLQIPQIERKKPSYYALLEDFADTKNSSAIFLVEGLAGVTNIANGYPKISAGIYKLMITNTAMILLSATNIYLISTNSNDVNSRLTIQTNQSNIIFMTNADFTYYWGSYKYDVDNNGIWDFIEVGFNGSNQVEMEIFHPENSRVDTIQFPIKRAGTVFVIQDINNDGKNEYILLDDKVTLLNGSKLP